MAEFEYAQSAREELLSLLNISRNNVPNYDELAELAGQCLEDQFLAGQRSRGDWVACADRLPEEGYVLAWSPTFRGLQMPYFHADRQQFEHEAEGTYTHWQPLPAPPQQEKE